MDQLVSLIKEKLIERAHEVEQALVILQVAIESTKVELDSLQQQVKDLDQ